MQNELCPAWVSPSQQWDSHTSSHWIFLSVESSSLEGKLTNTWLLCSDLGSNPTKEMIGPCQCLEEDRSTNSRFLMHIFNTFQLSNYVKIWQKAHFNLMQQMEARGPAKSCEQQTQKFHGFREVGATHHWEFWLHLIKLNCQKEKKMLRPHILKLVQQWGVGTLIPLNIVETWATPSAHGPQC